MERILVGVVGAPHGVRGEVRLKSFTAAAEAVGSYGPLQAEGRAEPLTIRALRPLKDDMLVARFGGVDTREAAAALTGTRLFVPRAALPAPDDEEFYQADLIGLAAFGTDGAALGRVRAVLNFGAGDILDITTEGGESLLVAFTRSFVPEVDLPGRRLVVAPGALEAEDGEEAQP